jgi:hypothetical protein
MKKPKIAYCISTFLAGTVDLTVGSISCPPLRFVAAIMCMKKPKIA